ncbi:MAG: hypothetical protein JSV88_20115 [Candidatus Aminicenantes bacterium]|nr:MAG: hypothetical protein JSV88_20115 [Candidatus Aminicenantes bacterium]
MRFSYSSFNSFNWCKRQTKEEFFNNKVIAWQVEEAAMSHLSYFSDMFHNLGSLSIELDKALNTMVRSYRTSVPDSDKEEAKEKLLSFLSLLSEKGEDASPVKINQIRKGLEEFITRQSIGPKINLIREKIESGKKLSKPEIDILDDLINQISHKATAAFRRMRKAG